MIAGVVHHGVARDSRTACNGHGEAARLHPAWRCPHPKTLKYAEPPLPAAPRDPDFAVRFRALTRHERNILRSLAEGLSYMAIAERYAIHPSTTKNLLTIIYRKLGVGGKGSAAKACYLLGRYDTDVDGGM